MIPLSQEEFDRLTQRAAGVLSNFQPGEDAVAVLSRIYRENLPDKSPRQGALMAQELIGWISLFRSGCDAASEDPEGYVRYMLTDMLKGQDPETRCRVLRSLIGAEQQSAGNGSEDPEALMEQAVALLSRCPALPAPENYDPQQAKLYCGEDMILAATAMMLYTMAKNGELPGMPRDLTLAQTALCVCANDSLCQLMWLEASGNIARQELSRLLNAVSLTFRMLWLTLVLPKAIAALTVSGTLAITAGGLATLATLGILTALAFREFDQMLSFGAEMVTEVPLNLRAMGSMTLDAPRIPQAAPYVPVLPAQPEEDILTVDNDDPAYF